MGDIIREGRGQKRGEDRHDLLSGLLSANNDEFGDYSQLRNQEVTSEFVFVIMTILTCFSCYFTGNIIMFLIAGREHGLLPQSPYSS